MKHYFYGRKGGVGTTTTAAAVARMLSENAKVLLVDCSAGADAFAVLGTTTNDAPTKVPNTENLWLYTSRTEAVAATNLVFVGYDEIVFDLGVTDDVPSDGHTYLVATNCYLTLRASVNEKPDVAILVMQDGRALSFEDASSVLSGDSGRVVRIPYDLSVARCVDAGMLAVRPPHVLRKGLGLAIGD